MNTVEEKCINLRWLVKLGCNNRRKEFGTDAGLKRVSHQSLFFLDNMGCASSAPEERRGPLVGGVPTKQGQADQEREEEGEESRDGGAHEPTVARDADRPGSPRPRVVADEPVDNGLPPAYLVPET